MLSVGENISLDSLKQSCIYTLDRRTKSAIRISSFTKTMKYSKKLKSRYLQIRLEMWSIGERLFSVHFHTMGAQCLFNGGVFIRNETPAVAESRLGFTEENYVKCIWIKLIWEIVTYEQSTAPRSRDA